MNGTDTIISPRPNLATTNGADTIKERNRLNHNTQIRKDHDNGVTIKESRQLSHDDGITTTESR